MARRRKIDPDEVLDPDELQEELEAEGALDARGLLRDGAKIRIPLYLRDGAINPRLTAVQRSIAATHQPLVVDGSRNPMAMHKPGFRYLADANRRAIDDAVKAVAYEDADEADQNAWRHPSARRAAEHTDNEPRRSQDAASSKAQAYEQYDREWPVKDNGGEPTAAASRRGRHLFARPDGLRQCTVSPRTPARACCRASSAVGRVIPALLSNRE